MPNLTCLSFRVLPHHCATLYGNRPLRNICPQLYHLCNGSRPFLTKSGMYPRTPGRSHLSRWQLIEALHTYLRLKSLMTYLRIIDKIFMTAFTGYQFVRLVICIYHRFRSVSNSSHQLQSYHEIRYPSGLYHQDFLFIIFPHIPSILNLLPNFARERLWWNLINLLLN